MDTYGDRTIVFERNEPRSTSEQLSELYKRFSEQDKKLQEHEHKLQKQGMDITSLQEDMTGLQFVGMRDVAIHILNRIHNFHAGSYLSRGWNSGFLQGRDDLLQQLHKALCRPGEEAKDFNETRNEARSLIDERNECHHLSPLKVLYTRVKECTIILDKHSDGRFYDRSPLVCAVLQKFDAVLTIFPDAFDGV